MSNICSCGDGNFNMGTPNCVDVFSRARRVWMVPIRQNNGTLNSIAPSDVIDQTYLDGKVSADSDQRWYPTPLLKNFLSERAEPFTETIEGIDYVTAQGNRTATWDLIGKEGSTGALKAWESFQCGDFGMFIETVGGQLVGYSPDGNANLLPIPLENRTLYGIFVFPQKETSSKVMCHVQIREDVRDGDLTYINRGDITADLSNERGLAQATLELTTSAATTLNVDASYTFFGTFQSPDKIEGLTNNGDWVVTNNTTSSTVAVSAVTETAAGVYELTIAAQTTSDVLQVEIDKTSVRFESNAPTVAAL